MTPSKPLLSLFSCLALSLLAGCGIASNSVLPPSPASGMSVSGMVRGGQQPVANATVTLLAPGLTGYGSPPVPITATTTNAAGQFTLPSYLCPANSGLVYLYVVGGNSGSGVNASLAEAALLGPCSSLTPNTFVVVSEVTTVTAAYALAPFASVTPPVTGIGTSLSNLTGLTNAFGAANNLANFATGAANAPTSIPGLILPQSAVNSLADILGACVNSSGATGPSTPCGTLFTAATPPAGTPPTDTFAAAIDIALNPAHNVATLFSLSTASGPFQPTLSTAPADWTLAIAYNGGAILNSGGTTGIGIDAAGNAWIGTGRYTGGFPVNPVHNLTEISPAGVYLSGASGFGTTIISGPEQLAIDETGNILIANSAGNPSFNNGFLAKFDSSGNSLGLQNASSFAAPNGLAIDAAGNSWASNFNNSFASHLGPSGAELAGSPVTTALSGAGTALSLSAVWVANYDQGNPPGSLTRINSSTLATLNVPTPGDTPSGMALDSTGNAWTTLVHSVAKSTDAGVLTTYSVGGRNIPQEVLVDGNNHTWASNLYVGATFNSVPTGTLIELANDGTFLSPVGGYFAGGVIPQRPDVPGGIAIDASGNVWITGSQIDTFGNILTGGNQVAEIIGVAAPVVTPLSVASKNNMLGQRP